jgi:soluble P-type ATPase
LPKKKASTSTVIAVGDGANDFTDVNLAGLGTFHAPQLRESIRKFNLR